MLVSLSLVSGMNEDISANCFVVYNIVVNPTALAKAAHRGRELGRENDMSWWGGGGGGGGAGGIFRRLLLLRTSSLNCHLEH